ncbi:MAG: carbon-nitrogen hydrolase family protein, partial [Anaerolineae bacterium]|nr:carbon-nitrogen hydrolase family protein [Anaerolineae bacterium]
SICYDMWFPETIRTLVSMGAEVILHPSMTPTIDRDLELTIARATAVQQQCYIFDINGIGDGGVGRSIVVGPEGAIIHQAGNGEEMIPIEIDLDQVRRSREHGLMRLGQVLKSFRDRPVEFPIYQNGARSGYFDSLGSLLKATRYKKAFQPGNGKSDLPK